MYATWANFSWDFSYKDIEDQLIYVTVDDDNIDLNTSYLHLNISPLTQLKSNIWFSDFHRIDGSEIVKEDSKLVQK